MADYTVIVDDDEATVLYGPDEDSWGRMLENLAYQGTLHNTSSQDASLSFQFTGGRQIVVRGHFSGNNDASNSAVYPAFQVDSQDFLKCAPNPPQNGGQFFCSASLDPQIINRTLSMFVNPTSALQQFHIDYIRHGSDAHAALSLNGTVVFVQSPDSKTPGLSFSDNWKTQHSFGSANDVKDVMQTSTQSSSVTYRFSGSSFAWWGCCMPPDTSSNAANLSYTIDGGDVNSVSIDEDFIQGPKCKDERILFQTQAGDLEFGNHTLEVSYGGDETKMPLTLCALAAVPLEFDQLDFHPSSSKNMSSPSSSSTSSPTATGSTAPDGDGDGKHHNKGSDHNDKDAKGTKEQMSTGVNTGLIVGIVVGIVFILISIAVIIYLFRRKRPRDPESRTFFSARRLAAQRTVPSVDLDPRTSPLRINFGNGASIAEAPPPLYHTPTARQSRFSWRSLSFHRQPQQHPTYTSSDYGGSVGSYNSTEMEQGYGHDYKQPETLRRYMHDSKGHTLDPVLPLP